MPKQRLEIEISGNDSKFGAVADRTMGRLNRIGGAARSAMGFLGVGLGVSALKSVVEYGSRVSDLAQSLGISAESLQKMEYAAGQLGISLEDITKSMQYMSRYAGEALGGKGQYQDIFARMGISMQDLKTLAPDQLFLRVAQNLSKAGNSAQLMADAIKIMGEKGGMVLGAMRDDFYGIATGAEAASRVISEDMIKSLDRLADAGARAGQGIRRSIGESVGWAWEQFEQAIAFYAAATLPGTNAQRQAAFVATLDQMRGVKSGGSASPESTSASAGSSVAGKLGSGLGASDALAKIGLFRGGSGDSNTLKAQLSEQRRANTYLAQIASTLNAE